MPAEIMDVKLTYTCPVTQEEQAVSIESYLLNVESYECGRCGSDHSKVTYEVECVCGESHTLVLYRDPLFEG